MTILCKSLATVALTLVLSLPAAAVTMKAVVTGTITEGFDATGVYGAARSDLAGKAVTVTYIFDPDLAGDGSTSPGYMNVVGGVDFGFPGQSPLLSVLVSIGTTTRGFAGGFKDYFSVRDVTAPAVFDPFEQWYGLAYSYLEANDGASTFLDYVESTVFYYYDGVITADLEAPFDYQVVPETSFRKGSFETKSVDPLNDFFEAASGEFEIDRIVVTRADDVAPVPLPASALLLLGALGGIAALRRRRPV
jgi:hypothetical protein